MAAAGLAAAGCGSRPAPSASAGQSLTPVSVQLTWLPQYQFAGYYVALKKGYYRQEGLNVTI
ncbi:MAG: ABC transporter substrate-binding protein, partial [Firmicutes bacterium]|nr:ABC transporter substrate-binding protein [Bacillota bacterium]